jgi:menaquinone-dependent protoporphyrinogen IX oxidase
MRVLVAYGSKMGGTAGIAELTDAGYWRDPKRIRGWAADVVMELLSLDQLGRLHA